MGNHRQDAGIGTFRSHQGPVATHAAATVATGRRRLPGAALWAALMVLGAAASAQALVITNSGYALPGGGSCTVSGVHSRGSGATVTCTGVNLAAHSNVYFGIRNASNVNGLSMDNGSISGSEVLSFSSGGGNTITYTSTTSVTSACPTCGFGTDTVSNTLTITRSSGSATIVSTGGNPASNGNGAIERLFKLNSGSTFTFEVDFTSSDPHFSGQSCTTVYDGTRVASPGGNCRGAVDLQFYWSDCGDGVIDSPEVCDGGACCTSSCTFANSSTVCRAAAGVCDAAETCTGSSTTCPADGKLSGNTCRASGGVCDIAETCNGVSNACPADAKSSGNICRASGGSCDVAETCDGVNNACPADAFVSGGTSCRAPGGVCDLEEFCTGSSPTCPADAKSVAPCRASAGVCDVAEQCDGVNNSCPADAKSTALCRASAGACDLAEQCDGVNNECPADTKSTAVCRAAAGTCDVAEQCDGVSDTCPADVVQSGGTECRAVADVCDIAEECDGVSALCPTDTFVSAGTECRASAGVCDVAEQCTGSSGLCPPDAFEPPTTVCRATTVGEECDAEETCTGSSADCPADGVEPTSTVCRGAADVCDTAETCDGVNKTCPADAVEPTSTICRAASDACDAAETCDGASIVCPADEVQPAGTSCRAAAGVCDLEETCDGSSIVCPSDAKSTDVCRAAADVCDLAETCDGVGDDCPSDAFQPDGTDCEDGAFCNGTQTCSSGVCSGGTNPCPGGTSCDESTDLCFVGDCPSVAAVCRTAQKNKVLIKDNADDNKDKFVWKWTKGAATTVGDLANPTATAEYALCFYAGTTAALINQAAVPPSGSTWSALGTKGFKYKGTGTDDGITKIVVKSGDAGKAKALVKGKGTNLPDFSLPIANGDLPLIVQLRNNETGVCWEGSFAVPKKNEFKQFNAKTP